jgi:hypothetical protein
MINKLKTIIKEWSFILSYFDKGRSGISVGMCEADMYLVIIYAILVFGL